MKLKKNTKWGLGGILLASLLLFSLSSFAKKAPAGKDSEWDPHGETCRTEGPCTYTRRETLPGNIKVEAQIVSLGAFKGDIEKIFDYAFGDVRRVASLLDDDDPSSEVSKVNDWSGRGFVEVGPEYELILTAAKKAYLWTDGAFDITTTPGIGNFKNIKIGDNFVFLKKEGMKISFKNIIHGFLADLLIRAIYNSNVDSAVAIVGPASRSIGSSVVGHWRTEVGDTEGRYAKRGMTLDSSNISTASVVAGENAPDTDPRWGTPLLPYCRSVTIISRNAAISEALAHGVFILGPKKGMALIKTLVNIKGVIVDSSGSFLKSPGL